VVEANQAGGHATGADIATRKPILLLRTVGSPANVPAAERQKRSGEDHAPPRKSRVRESAPVFHGLPSAGAPS
jgi:hypothetical protein